MPLADPISESTDLPEPPFDELRLVEDRSPPAAGFLRYLSRVFELVGAGQNARPFTYDEVDRRGIDAVVVAPYYLRAGVPYVVLRSALRPPVAFRDPARSPEAEPDNRTLWEVPAGLIEPEEAHPEGLALAAARELLEETGFRAAPGKLVALGPSTYPCPGVIAEKQFFFRVEVDPGEREEPELDGSALEAVGRLVAVPLQVALGAARAGRLADAKTELALRRLEEALA